MSSIAAKRSLTHEEFLALPAHEALAHAHSDFKALLLLPNHRGDMRSYISHGRGECSVCLAGAAMVNTLKIDYRGDGGEPMADRLSGISVIAISGPYFDDEPERWHDYIRYMIKALKRAPNIGIDDKAYTELFEFCRSSRNQFEKEHNRVNA